MRTWMHGQISGGVGAPRQGWLVLLLALLILTPPALGADDIQLFNLGPHAFYVPKAWMGSGAFHALGARSDVSRPQPAPIVAMDLIIFPRYERSAQWDRFALRDLPDFIRISYSAGTRLLISEKHRRAIEQAASMEPDQDGFVRIATGFTRPGEPPQWERFVYKDYLNVLGEPLVVESDNDHPFPSVVRITLQSDLRLEYRFDNRKFPREVWWDLYQRVVAFLDYLQVPK
jgi:hypothetical protein